MVSIKRERTLVVIELEGGNDALNTVIPYSDGLYYDLRPGISVPQSEVLKINGDLGFNSSMSQMKYLWDEGDLAIINGIGIHGQIGLISGQEISGTQPNPKR